MTYAQLPRQPKPGVTLYCPACDAHFSAYRGDYFLRDPDEQITCSGLRVIAGRSFQCRAALYLVQRQHAPQHMITPADAEEQKEPQP